VCESTSITGRINLDISTERAQGHLLSSWSESEALHTQKRRQSFCVHQHGSRKPTDGVSKKIANFFLSLSLLCILLLEQTALLFKTKWRRLALGFSTIMGCAWGAGGAGAGRRRAVVVLHLRKISKYDPFSRSKASRSIETIFRMHLALTASAFGKLSGVIISTSQSGFSESHEA
jgi:hypothetical protein